MVFDKAYILAGGIITLRQEFFFILTLNPSHLMFVSNLMVVPTMLISFSLFAVASLASISDFEGSKLPPNMFIIFLKMFATRVAKGGISIILGQLIEIATSSA